MIIILFFQYISQKVSQQNTKTVWPGKHFGEARWSGNAFAGMKSIPLVTDMVITTIFIQGSGISPNIS